jgi:hypothetical protein
MINRAALLLCFWSNSWSVDWTWSWTPAAGDMSVSAAVSPFKYGKDWAYAIEIDDGPKWVRTFAVPFLAAYSFTDAPPGVPGGRRIPFVASVATVAASTGFNSASVDWADLRALVDAGWGVMNHSFDHRGKHWEEAAKLDDRAVTEDAYWSQTLLAAGLPGLRAPSGAVYANGYTDYNRNGVLAQAGIAIATRVGGKSPRDLTSQQVDWLDFPRNYLDDGVWTKNGGEPMWAIPGANADGPSPGTLLIDFTHVIDQKPDSANQRRWRIRLETIERRWGAGGADRLWCAPTAEIADYVKAAKAAAINVKPGRLSINLPDSMPGSALTLRLRGIGAKALVAAPPGGALHRQDGDVVLTTPLIGTRGAAPPTPALIPIYDGKPVSTDFGKPARIAGVILGINGRPKADSTWTLALRTSSGEKPIGSRTLTAGMWVAAAQLCPLVPSSEPLLASGITVTPTPEVQRMVVWAIADP